VGVFIAYMVDFLMKDFEYVYSNAIANSTGNAASGGWENLAWRVNIFS
jgi:hypothetical protein